MYKGQFYSARAVPQYLQTLPTPDILFIICFTFIHVLTVF